jgi:hypothetical protein
VTETVYSVVGLILVAVGLMVLDWFLGRHDPDEADYLDVRRRLNDSETLARNTERHERRRQLQDATKPTARK